MHPVRISLIALVGVTGIAAVAPTSFQRAPAPLVVHEWGTITTIHAPTGTPSGCLNQVSGSDALPDFVHTFEPAGLARPTGAPGITATGRRIPFVKSAIAPCRPDVTMRLETPVIYFHPAPDAPPVPPFDVTVHFRSGVLNEFYPNGAASVSVDGDQPSTSTANLAWNGATLDNTVVSLLRWRGVTLGGGAKIPQTDAHVWLAPRNVDAAAVTTTGEAEQYLFYRGVAHLDAVLRTTRSANGIQLLAPVNTEWMRSPTADIGGAWLVDIRANGTASFRAAGPIRITKTASSAALASLPLFADADYRADGVADLRATMKTSLVAAGLFDDEAAAMLETWSNSYFRTPGLRLFYLVPREWTDHFLPLDISVPSTITRVIVGRIDLTP